MATQENLALLIERHVDELFSLQDVAGVAEGLIDSRPCIKIYLTQENAETRLGLPDELDGYPVVIEVTGSFNKGV
jgi:hypothetical protein